MTISINAHGIDQVLVRPCTDFVTVEFATQHRDTVSLFFPDHAAVQRMIAELMQASREAEGIRGHDVMIYLPAR